MHATSPIQHALRRVGRSVIACALTVSGAVVTVAVSAAVLPAPSASAAPPAFLGTLAGPSQAAMYPSGLEYDAANDRLVVADTGRDRVLFYSLTGTKLGGFGSYGTDPGQFASPRDAAVDEVGNIYVADAENNRIQAFTSTGTFLWQQGGTGSGNNNLNTPIGVTWDSQNDVLLVASTGQNKIKAFSATGVFQWSSPDLKPNNVTGPRDVERGPDGKLWVTSYDQHQIKVFDVGADGNWTGHLTPFWTLGDGLDNGHGVNQMNYPYNVVFSADGNTAYIADTGNGRILRYDISGAQPQWIDPPFGSRCDNHPQPCEDPPVDQGKFNHLRRVAIDPAGNIYGADFWGAGIEVFDPNGNPIRSIEGNEPPAPGFAEAYSADVANSGKVYVMDRLNHRIESFNANGSYDTKVGARGTQLGTFSWPEAVAAAPDGTVWAADTRGDRIEQFSGSLSASGVKAFGGNGTAVGKYNYPEGLTVDSSGVVWVADTRNHRIQKYDPSTQTFSVIGSQGTGAGQFTQPMGVAVTANAVYVADTGNDRIQKLSLTGVHQTTSTTVLNGPEGLDVAPDGTVWVADTQNNRLVHLSANLTDLGDGFGSLGTGDTQFFNPHDLAFGNDKMYVADTYNDRVQMFDMPGPTEPPPADLDPAYRDQISDPGGVAPLYPAGVEIVDGTWYVADSGGSRVVTVNPTTGAATPLSATGLLNDPRDLEVDAADPTALWVTDTGGNRIVRIARTGGAQLGTPLGNLNQPYGLTNDATRVYVANTYGNQVRAYNRNGTVAWNQTTCGGTAFSRPRDVGLLDSGEVAVADTDNHRIVVLNAADGSCVREFGGNGTAAGKFKSPRSVTADGAGGVWVADALNYRVQHLTATGSPLGTQPAASTTPGEGNGEFRSAHCVTPIPGSTEVAVCDTFNFRIQVWDGAGSSPTWQRNVGGTKPANGGFNGAFAVAYGPDGSLYAADWFNHRIQKFDANGNFVTAWGGYGQPNGSLIFPRGIVVSPTGDVVVTDSENNRIDVFTSSGTFVKSVKPPTGTTLSRPHQTALDGTGGYWIADTNNNRVLHLSSTGAVLANFPITGTAANSKPEGIAVDTDGSVLVSNTANNRVERYSSAGALLGTAAANGTGANQVKTPGGLLVTGAGQSRRLWIADKGNNRVVVQDSTGGLEVAFGSAGSGAGQFTQPRGVAVDPTDGDIAVADFGNNRISLWDPQGSAPVDTANPTVAFTSPASGASLPAGTVAVAGTSSDDTSVAAVDLQVQRSSDSQWLQANGTWGGTQTFVPATLASPGAGSSGWTYSVPATTAGTYSMTARVTDQANKTGQATRSFSVAAADTTAPDTAITSPAANATVTTPTTTFTGTATDNAGVSSVTILIKDRDTGLWRQTNGTWASTTAGAQNLATVSPVGGTSPTWTLADVALAPGNYLVTARARDAAGNQDATPGSSQFSVRSADTTPPDGTMTSPVNNAQVPLGPVQLVGNATDNVGVTVVQLGIQDTVTKEWMRANGTFAAGYATVNATLGSPGAASTGWTFTFNPPVARKYGISVIAKDANGNADPTKPWVTIQVVP
jgi:DNA-binding beta-propeller fold protein YncE